MNYYISSCMFSGKFPELSKRIRDYIEKRGDLKMVRCCVKGWKVQQYIEKMPEGEPVDGRHLAHLLFGENK